MNFRIIGTMHTNFLPHPSAALRFRCVDNKKDTNASTANKVPKCAFCSTDSWSATMLPINVPKAIPKCKAELFRLCCISDVSGDNWIRWLWIGGVIAQLNTPQITKTNQKNINEVYGMVNKQTPKSTITVNSVRLMPNLSAENPPIGVSSFLSF